MFRLLGFSCSASFRSASVNENRIKQVQSQQNHPCRYKSQPEPSGDSVEHQTFPGSAGQFNWHTCISVILLSDLVFKMYESIQDETHQTGLRRIGA